MTPILLRKTILRSRSKSVESKRISGVERRKVEKSKSVDRSKRVIVLERSVVQEKVKGKQVVGMCHGVDWNPLSITTSTHRKHNQLLELVGHRTPQQIVSFLREERRLRRWRWSTLRTKVGNLYGANTMSGYRCFPVNCPVMRDFRRYVDHCVLREQPKFPRALTFRHAKKIIELLKLKKEFRMVAVFSLWWACAARLSDIFLIHTNRITVEDTTITITFVEGKGVKARGEPYTMCVVNPFATHVESMISSRMVSKSTYLITRQQQADMTKAFKNVLHAFDTRYELRSPRRGALQVMAMEGTALSVLRTISGHRSDAMLLRYLDWGRFAAVQSKAQVTATNLLWS